MDSFKKADGTVVFVSEDNPLPVDAVVNVGDVEMGAVEIKDATGATRAKVRTDAPASDDAALVTRVAGSVTISDGSGPVTVDGTVEIVNDVGNPIPVNGTVTITDGSGPVTVDGTVDTELPAAAALADATANPTTPIVGNAHHMFNGATWDRVRNNREIIVLASAAQTTTQTSADQTSYNARGLHFIIHVTTPGTGSITPKIQGKDANGNYYDILIGLPITTAGTTVLKIGPGITPVANGAAADFLPRTFRTVITANNANSMTYDAALALVV